MFSDMTNNHRMFFLVCLSLVFVVLPKNVITEIQRGQTLSRQKRYLIFPDGSNVQLVFCLTIGGLARKGDLVVGMTSALAWELPTKVDPKATKLLHRKSRSVIFPKIEALLQSAGLDGKSCVMRAICEAVRRDDRDVGSGTFVQELLHAIFKLKNDGNIFERQDHRIYDFANDTKTNCAEEYPACRHSIYELDF
ncbi:uncharacterized protein [Chelonus insularis]|uniref:uncharacterized protein n=1 Tax=Chelonus insularis TaxID=460826 RepID=UPI001588AA69|nr:uncharacterized protein LOC118064545 [Chelonus insularis]